MPRKLTPARAWLRARTQAARAATRRVVAVQALSTLLAIGQAACAALLLAGVGLLWPALGFGVAALLRAGLAMLAERLAFDAGATARRRLRDSVLSVLLDAGPLDLGLAKLRGRHSAELAGITVDAVEALDGYHARWLPAMQMAVLGPALVGLAVIVVNPAAGIIIGLCGLLVPVAMALAGIGAAAASRRQFRAMQRLQTRFVDRIRGIATIVLANRAEAEAAALASAADELRQRTLRVLRVAFLSSVSLDMAVVLAIILVVWQDGFAWQPRALFALWLVPEFFAPIRAFAAAYQDQMAAGPAAEKLAELPTPAEHAPPPAAIRTVAAHGVTVAFENVRFAWDEARGPALEGLSFRVPAGETLILTGPSGSGKTTIMELLLGFATPQQGRITFNGADAATLVPAARMRLIAWIGQRPMLFAATIAENIRFAKPEATAEEVQAAIRFARLEAVIAALPQGLETPIGEGGFGLSGGQAQRVAIARAFLKGAPLLLLDEPTAHLDPVTEAEVLDSLRRLALGRTVVLASHASAAHAFPGRRLDLATPGAAERGVA
ncbi:MAG: thiol reductant ABC exporter subunit CydD [Rhodospirillales bacterium]|jgi:ATP-binding cassette subfamily C protein CydD|nr:thiol reductant ABC exporter subunit CydD [Rhodospirillales bacterium]